MKLEKAREMIAAHEIQRRATISTEPDTSAPVSKKRKKLRAGETEDSDWQLLYDGEESVVLSQLQAEKQAAADAVDEKNPDAASVEELSLRESRVAAFQAYVRTS